MRFRGFFVAVSVFFTFLIVTGCGVGPATGPELDVPSATITGVVHGGQQPVFGATVSIYQVGSTSYGVAASTTPVATTTSSLTNGSFTFGSYTCAASNTPMYIVATGGTPGGYSTNSSLALMALIPACTAGKSSTIIINEVTTAAAILAAGQFMGTGLGSSNAVPQIGATCTSCSTGTYNQGLVNAFSNTYPQLVNNATGTAVASSTSGSLTITTEASKLNTIANVLAACVNSTGATSTTETTTTCGKLFTGVNETAASPRPSNTIQAALLMDLYPWYNVPTVYGLGSATSPFTGLSTTPNDWTVAVSYTTSSFGLGIQQNSSSNLDIDTAGNVWFPSNKTGAVGLGYFSPSTTTFNGPYAGTNLTYPQYVAIDTSSPAYAWTTDLSSKYIAGAPTLTGSAISLNGGSSFTSAGPLAIDTGNNVMFMGGSSLYAISSARSAITLRASGGPSYATGLALTPGNPQSGTLTALSTSTGPCTEVYFAGGFSTVATSTGSSCKSGGAASFVGTATLVNITVASTSAQLCDNVSDACQAINAGANLPEGLIFDGAGNLWFANSGNGSVSNSTFWSGFDYTNFNYETIISHISTNGYLHNSTNGGTLTTPYGIAIDRSGNVWVSNASCVSSTSTPCSATSFTLTEIVGAATPTLTPLAAYNLPLFNNNAPSPPTN